MTTRRDTIDPRENSQGKDAAGDSLLMARTIHLIYKVCRVSSFHKFIYFVIKYGISKGKIPNMRMIALTIRTFSVKIIRAEKQSKFSTLFQLFLFNYDS